MIRHGQLGNRLFTEQILRVKLLVAHVMMAHKKVSTTFTLPTLKTIFPTFLDYKLGTTLGALTILSFLLAKVTK